MSERCTHTKADGTPCKAWAATGSRFCFFHRGTEAKPARPRRRALPRVKLDTIDDARKELARIYRGIWSGALSPSEANAASLTLSYLMRAVEGSDFERRLDELRARIEGKPALSVVGGKP